MTPRVFKPEEVEFFLERYEETMPVAGNVLASGNPIADELAEKWIYDQLEGGHEWAWCTVRVAARWAGFTGSTYLGGVSYESFESFAENGELENMIDEAVADLLRQIRGGGWKVTVFEGSLIAARARGLAILTADYRVLHEPT
jgi:hypothetical protein